MREGTLILEDLYEKAKDLEGYPLHLLALNVANGHNALFALKRKRRARICPPNEEALQKAKRYYRIALSRVEPSNLTLRSQILVNLGNCLSAAGRFSEATAMYFDAAIAEPNNAMASGNLGIELERISRIVSRYRHEYIGLAHQYLARALGPESHFRYGSPSSRNIFRSTFDRIGEFISSHADPIDPPRPAVIEPHDDEKPEYQSFCLQHGLFLNAWVGDQALTPAIVDELSFGPVVTSSPDDSMMPELLHILNEVKETYSTARYLFFLSQTKRPELDSASKATIYFDVGDYDVNGIYIGLCKTAYARAFDILDKVSRISNVYFGLGGRIDGFWKVYAEKRSLGADQIKSFAARPAVCEKGNPGLFALADLCIDYFEGEDVDLKSIDRRRNQITHDYLRVKLFRIGGNASGTDVLSAGDLFRQTYEVLQLAKHAILYAVSAVAIAENAKLQSSDGITVPMIYDTKTGDSVL